MYTWMFYTYKDICLPGWPELLLIRNFSYLIPFSVATEALYMSCIPKHFIDMKKQKQKVIIILIENLKI